MHPENILLSSFFHAVPSSRPGNTETIMYFCLCTSVLSKGGSVVVPSSHLLFERE